jgi:hypothetical protein
MLAQAGDDQSQRPGGRRESLGKWLARDLFLLTNQGDAFEAESGNFKVCPYFRLKNCTFLEFTGRCFLALGASPGQKACDMGLCESLLLTGLHIFSCLLLPAGGCSGQNVTCSS